MTFVGETDDPYFSVSIKRGLDFTVARGSWLITNSILFATYHKTLKLPEKSKDTIFRIITKRQNYFNGIGTSHANEILHLAQEHPAQKASVVFEHPASRKRLLYTIIKFFAFANDDRYTKAAPAGRSGGSAFYEPQYITKDITALQQRVYGHIRAPTKISKEHYTDLLERKLLDAKH